MTSYGYLRALNNVSNEEDFKIRLKHLLEMEESGGFEYNRPYGDPEGYPTIGIGFNILSNMVKTSNLEVALPSLGINSENPLLSEEGKAKERGYIQQIKEIFVHRWPAETVPQARAANGPANSLRNALDAIMHARNVDPLFAAVPNKPDTFTFTTAQINDVYERFYQRYKTGLEQFMPDLPYSSERIALQAMIWGSDTLKGNDLKHAILSESRAEAWYEIRYRSNGDKSQGIANRRYQEAAYFSLHDEGKMNISQASEIYVMFTKHKYTSGSKGDIKVGILEYEQKFTPYDSRYSYIVPHGNIEWALGTSHDFLVNQYAQSIDIGVKNIYASKDHIVSVTRPEAGNAMILGTADSQTLQTLNGRSNVLVAVGGSATLVSTKGSQTNYLINEGSSGAGFHIRGGSNLAIGKAGSNDIFYVNASDTTTATVLIGGKGVDEFHVTSNTPFKIYSVYFDTSLPMQEYMFANLIAGKNANDIIIVNPDSSDKFYLGTRLLASPDWTNAASNTFNSAGPINDAMALVRSSETAYALKQGDTWYSTNPWGSNGAAFDPSAGHLAVKSGTASVEFVGFVNGAFGISLPNGPQIKYNSSTIYKGGPIQTVAEQSGLIVPANFYKFHGDRLDAGDFGGPTTALAAVHMAARMSIEDAESPLVGDSSANDLDPAGEHDFVSGGGGGDTIHYNVGYGAVTIEEIDGATTPNNVLAFGADVDPAQVQVSGDADGNLIIALGGDDTVTLNSGLLSGGGTSYGVQHVTFADGTSWSYADLLARALTAGAGSDGVFGDGTANTLDSQGLVSQAVGGGGGDTFVYEASYGFLTIDERDTGATPANILAFGAGIDPEDVTASGDEDGDIWLTLADGGQVQIVGGLLSDSDTTYGVQSVTFADGTTWSYADLLDQVSTASADNTAIFGDGAANTLDSGGLATTVKGGGGGDTFVFEAGYGALTITEADSAATPSNTLAFGVGIDPADVTVFGSGDGDIVMMIGDGDDMVTLAGALGSTDDVAMGVQQVTFDDGTVWDYADLFAKVSTATAGSYSVYGDATANTLDTGGFASYASGGGGGDTFVYELGYGEVVIAEQDSAETPTNTLAFGTGIDPADVAVSGDADGSIVLTLAGGDRIVLLGELADTASGVQAVTFAGGASWSYADLLAKATTASATNTALFGDAGANDFDPLGLATSITGGGGGDTFHYGVGYGDLTITEFDQADAGLPNTLVLGPGIGTEDVAVSANDQGDLLLMIGGDTITLTQALLSDQNVQAGVHLVSFDDGTVWSFADLVALAGTAGVSGATIYGDASGNWLDSMGIASTVAGGGGGDTIRYEAGYGALTIRELETGTATNTLAFGDGVDPAGITVSADGDDLLLSLGGSDVVRIVGAFTSDDTGTHGVQKVSFANGATWSVDQLAGFVTGAIDFTLGYGDLVIDSAANPAGAVPAIDVDPAIAPEDVTVTVRAEDRALVLTLPDGSAIVLQHALDTASASLQEVLFADGTTWTFADLIAQSHTASEYNTYLAGTGAAETFDSGGFATEIAGGGGGDVFVYQPGYGVLTIDERDGATTPANQLAFGEGIDAADVRVSGTSDGDLVVTVSDTDSVILRGALLGGAGDARGVQQVTFADGTVWTDADLRARVLAPQDGDPGVYGAGGSDTIDSQGMASYAFGGGGGDTFVYETGYGALTIDEADAAQLADNRLLFGAGITQGDLFIDRDGDDLLISVGGGDEIRVAGQYRYDGTINHGVQRLVFADGSELRLDSTMFGTSGADTLDPLGIATRVDAGGGGDTIQYEAGYGALTISETDTAASPANALVIGAGIDPLDVVLAGDESGALILSLGGDDEIVLENALNSVDGVSYGVQTVSFADGTIWSLADMLTRVATAADGADEIFGGTGADTLDTQGLVYAAWGNGGGDTFVYGADYGDVNIRESDTGADPDNVLVLGETILPEDVQVVGVDGGIQLILGATGSIIAIDGALESAGGVTYGVQQVQFADGTVWSYQDLLDKVLVPSAFATLEGDTGANLLDTAGLTDAIIGRGGGDTIRYATGYGDLDIDETDTAGSWSENTLAFDAGIAPGDVLASFDGDTGALLLKLPDDSVITVRDMQWNGGDGIQRITFDDGTIWDRDAIWAQTQVGRADNVDLVGRIVADTFDPAGFAHRIQGGGGGDLIHYALGYGDLEIDEFDSDASAVNTLSFAAGITVADVSAALDTASDSLILTLSDGAVITITDGLADGVGGVQQIVFDDGTVWDREAMRAQTQIGSAGNTELFGRDGVADTFDPNGQANLIHTGGGNDTILYAGGYGAVTIDSFDTAEDPANRILLAAGLAPEDASVQMDGDDIVLDFGNGDTVRLQAAMQSHAFNRYGVQIVEFADGTIWSDAQLRAKALLPVAGQTEIVGTSFADDLDSLGIATQIYAQGGGDTVHYARGYGDLTIDEVNNTDTPNTLVFGADIDPDDVTLSLDPDHGHLTLSLGGGDDITLSYFMSSLPGITNGFDTIRFDDGTIWSRDDLFARINAPTSPTDTIVGDGTANLLDTQGIAHSIIGGGGGDLILFNRGYGQLLIAEDSGFLLDGAANVLRFGAGIDPASVIVHGVDSFDPTLSENVTIDVGDGDIVTLRYAFDSPDQYGVRIEFADGTIWSMADVLTRANTATAGDDSLLGSWAANVISGGAGNDFIDGRDGNDILTGGTGDDWVSGGAGDDTYRFAPGDGQDKVQELVDWNSGSGGDDAIELAAGIDPADVRIFHSGEDLYLRIGTDGDSIRIVNGNGFSGSEYVEEIRFDDGTIWSYSDMLDRAENPGPTDGPFLGTDHDDWLPGSAAADELQGLAGNDRLDGRGGNDTLIGGEGDDILNGGAGNDLLEGGAGSDDYTFAIGDGQDVISGDPRGGTDVNILDLDSGITPADVTVSLGDSGHDLVIAFAGSTDTVTIDEMNADPATGIDQLRFGDGTVWTHDELLARTIATAGDDSLAGTSGNDLLMGLGGDDTLAGLAGDDTLVGGTGSDVLTGGGGGDVYRYAAGDGSDVINDYGDGAGGSGGDDALEFGTGIAPGDVTVTRSSSGDDLLLTLGDGSVIRLQGTITDATDKRIEEVRFADGTIWSHADMLASSDVGAATVTGDSGDNSLYGGFGRDVFDGGAGDDYLEGTYGNDEYRYASGDGSDRIHEIGLPTDIDVLRLTDLNPGDVELRREGTNLYVRDLATGDDIQVDDQFYSNETYGIERIIFADGTVWNHDRIQQEAWIRGTSGDDTLYGTNAGETLIGNGGDDTLQGGYGSDSYRYASGDGDDDIVDVGSNGDVDILRLTDLDPAGVELRREGSHLFIFDPAGGGTLRIQDQFGSGDAYGLEQIVFGDGTVWDRDRIRDEAWLRGTAGDDSLYGSSQGETIAGGTGDDYLEGGNGSDTYVYASGDGNDEILDNGAYSDIDTLKLTDLNLADVTLARDGYDLLVTDDGTGQQIRVTGQFGTYEAYGIEQIVFADGTVRTADEIGKALPIMGTSGYDTLLGSDRADTLIGGGDGDFLEGEGGSDDFIYASGDGSDFMGDFGGRAGDVDRLVLTDLNPEDVSLNRTALNLLVTDLATGSQITVQGQYGAGASGAGVNPGLEQIVFADGTIVDRDDLDVVPFRGTDDFDYIEGSDQDDIIIGNGGDDNLRGNAGGDTYVYASGDGNDQINEFGNPGDVDILRLTGIDPDDVTLRRTEYNMYVRDGNTGQEIEVFAQFYAALPWGVDKIVFDDGTEWDRTAMQLRIGATDYNDYLVGDSGDNAIDGLGGADTIVGLAGDDTLAGNVNNDTLIGDDFSLAPTGDNLLVNGSFETSGTFAGSGSWGIANSTLPGWTKTNSQNFEQSASGNGGVAASDGDYWLDMDSAGGTGSNMSISQTVSGLTLNEELLLQFDFANRTDINNGGLNVYWNGDLVLSVRESGTTMQTKDLALTAIAGDNVLTFTGVGDEDNTGASLDNVRLRVNGALYGAAGDDILTGGAGDDTLIGGDGTDTAIFSGQSYQYTVVDTGIGFAIVDSVGARDGTDQLRAIETLQFADGSFDPATRVDHWADPASILDTASEGDPVGTFVVAGAADYDGDVLYSLADDADGRFAIDAGTGVVTYTGDEPLSGAQSYAITVRAAFGEDAVRDIAATIGVEHIDAAPSGLTFEVPIAAPTAFAGSASQNVDGWYELTPNTAGQTGAVWGKIDLTHDAVWDAQIYLGWSDGGADGVSFGFQDASMAVTGAYGALTDHSFGILWDTYANPGEPNTDFSRFVTDGDQSTGFDYVAHANLEDSNWHDISVRWNAATSTLSYSLDGVDIASKDFDVATMFDDPSNMFWGVGANTGGAYNEQAFSIVSLRTTADQLAVDENAVAGTIVGYLHGVDSDAGDTLSYAITDGDGDPVTDSNFEIVSGNQLRVKSGADIDFETADALDLHIKVTDGDGLSTVVPVSVAVRDVFEPINTAPTGLGFEAPIAAPSSLVGSASQNIDGWYELTPNTAGQTGAVWGKIDLTHDAVWDAQIYLGWSDGGADGVSFGFQDAGMSVTGAYGALTDHSFGILWDTYANPGEPNTDFSRFVTDGDQSTGFDYVPHANLENSNWHDISVRWNAGTSTLSYSLDGVDIASKSFDVATTFDDPSHMYWGVGANTGGAYNEQAFSIVSLRTATDQLAVDENAATGTLVGYLNGVDANEGDVLSYAITDSDGDPVTDSNFEIVSGNQLRVKSGADIDFETADALDLHIKVTDGGGLSTVVPITVAVRNLVDSNEAPTALRLLVDVPATAMSLAGSASQTDDTTYQLTPNSGGQNGAIWGGIDLSHDTVWTTRMYFGGSDGGADGISFALQNASDTALGAGALTSTSLGIMFDTYSNSGEPGSDFSQMILDNSSSSYFDVPHLHANLEDNGWHDVVVSWNAESQTLAYSLDGTRIASRRYDIVGDVLGGDPNGYFGFGGRTGGAYNEQDVEIVAVEQAVDHFEVAADAADETVIGKLLGIDPNGDTLSYAITDASGTALADDWFEIADGRTLRVKSGADLGELAGLAHTLHVKVTDGDGASLVSSVEIDVSESEALRRFSVRAPDPRSASLDFVPELWGGPATLGFGHETRTPIEAANDPVADILPPATAEPQAVPIPPSIPGADAVEDARRLVEAGAQMWGRPANVAVDSLDRGVAVTMPWGALDSLNAPGQLQRHA